MLVLSSSQFDPQQTLAARARLVRIALVLPVNHLVEPLRCSYSAWGPGVGRQCVSGWLPYHGDFFARGPSLLRWPSHYCRRRCVKVTRLIQIPNAFSCCIHSVFASSHGPITRKAFAPR